MSQLSLLCLLLTWLFVHAKDYCTICEQHTMCRFTRSVGPACGNITEGTVSKSEIEQILNLHNEYRAKVANGKENRGSPGPQPTAANMQTLIWDERLADVAQRWANQCIFQHDKCRDDPRFLVGQNIYWASGKESVDWSRAIQIWFDEVASLNSSRVNNYDFDYETGHYAQLIWAKTRYIGCGRRTYQSGYRIQDSKPIEYILADIRDGNSSASKDENHGYFGEKISNLTEGMKGAITSKDSNRFRKSVDEESGFFGGAEFDPMGAQGAVTSTNEKKPSAIKPSVKPVTGYPQIFYRPSYSPYGIYPGYLPYYPYGQYRISADDRQTQDTIPRSPKKLSNVLLNTLRLTSYNDEKLSTQTKYEVNKNQILICNYGPSADYVNANIYEIGTPCSKCPTDTTCKGGLCKS